MNHRVGDGMLPIDVQFERAQRWGSLIGLEKEEEEWGEREKKRK